MTGKPLWASKTFWTNIVGLAAFAASVLGIDAGLDDPKAQAEIVGAILVFANIVLRLKTDQPIRKGKST